MIKVVRSILECPERNKDCPVARKFRETAEGPLIPEAYLGSPKAKFMIVGINPGITEVKEEKKTTGLMSYLMRDAPPHAFERDADLYIEVYQRRSKDFLKLFVEDAWQYRRVCKIFNYSPENGEVMITNLAHCPTTNWSEDLNTAFEHCYQFCKGIEKEVGPELVLLHGLPVVRFFSRLFNWNVKNKDIPIKKERNGRSYVLSRHLQSPTIQKDWKALENIAKTLKEGKSSQKHRQGND